MRRIIDNGSGVWPRRRRIVALFGLVVSLICTASAKDALACTQAAALAHVRGSLLNIDKLPFAQVGQSFGTQDFRQDPRSDAIVGLWFTTFRLEDQTVWNKGFQQYHADKTEISVDNAVPPSLGNVCVGVWKNTEPGTVKLRHVTFNWNADGSPAGTFLLLTTVKVDRTGNSYSGRFVSDSFDVANRPIPELHAEGTVRGVRITVD